MISKYLALPVFIFSFTLAANTHAAHMEQYKNCMHAAFKRLDLNKDQKTKVKALREKMRAETKDQWTKMQAVHNQVKELIQSEKLDEGRLDALVNEKKEVIGEVMKIKIKTKHEIYQLFTPKQKEKFSALSNQCEEKMMKAYERMEKEN